MSPEMESLKAQIRQIDGRGYKAYKGLQGRYRFDRFELWIDHVQGDPFAEPSRIRLSVPAAIAQLPADSYGEPIRRLALQDFLCRRLALAIDTGVQGQRGSGRSGEIRIASCGQQVLARDALIVEDGRIEARLGLALPAAGRRVLARDAEAMLFAELPQLVDAGLCYQAMDQAALQAHLDAVQDQDYLRQWLAGAGLVAFVGDGARLPRRSGIDDRPLMAGAIPFVSPPSLAVEPVLPHAGNIRGMGIPGGVTLIVGGGFHGKSTLLQALERGVYNHIPGDGRERVVTDPTAVKIRAEDGRSINRVDISGFINHLPLGKDTCYFCTDNASGSTSQAANIMEALCAGCRTLLIDEDTSATNFMIRDQRMQRLVAAEREPITPLLARIRGLFVQQGVSTLLVTGGSGAYFDVADRVILMDQYRAQDVSDQAHRLTQALPEPSASFEQTGGMAENGGTFAAPLDRTAERQLKPDGLLLDERGRIKMQAFGCDTLRLGDFSIDLARVEQLVEPGQLRAIGWLMTQLLQPDPRLCEHEAAKRDHSKLAAPLSDTLLDRAKQALQDIERQGLDRLSPYYPEPHGGLTLPRLQELYAALNRLRELPLQDRPFHNAPSGG